MFIRDKNVLAIVDKTNNKVIGSIGLHTSWCQKIPSYQNLRIIEVGYVLAKPYWGKGLMVEVLTALMNYCFENDIVDGISVSHFIDNAQSKRVIEKLGFTYIKESTIYANKVEKHYLYLP